MTGILVCTLAAGMAWAQNPQVLQNVRTQMNTVQQSSTAASNQALGVKSTPARESAKPATSAAKSSSPAKASAPSVKPTAAPAKSSAASVKPATAPAKSSTASVKATTAPAKSSAASVKPAVAKVSAPTAKSSAATVKTNSAPAKAAVVPAKAAAAPVKATTASAPAVKKAEPFQEKKPASASPAPKLGVKQVTAKKQDKPAATKKTAVAPEPDRYVIVIDRIPPYMESADPAGLREALLAISQLTFDGGEPVRPHEATVTANDAGLIVRLEFPRQASAKPPRTVELHTRIGVSRVRYSFALKAMTVAGRLEL